jgi:CRP/FNR family transcriptional regulator, anaerobic regulatory protein
MPYHPEHIETLTPVVVSPFKRSDFARLFIEHPRLTAIMYVFAQEERITACDRMGCIGQLDCKERLAFLLLDVLNRVRAIDASTGSTFEMHLAREQTAEITGMTLVHAGRMWNELIADGCIATDGQTVVILDEARLQSLSGYVYRSANLDLSWIPSIPIVGQRSPRLIHAD